MQLAPVMVFAPFSPSLGTNYWAGGNYYGVMPYEGRYDALLPTTVGFDKELGIFATSKLLPELNGELRDIKWLNYGGEQVLVLAMNNQGLKFIRPIKKSKL
jgi:hypothetical protein